jgi:DNA-binding NtrC family response regulator
MERHAAPPLTAQTDLETKDRAAAVNPVGFLQKPVHPERLVRAIQTAVGETTLWDEPRGLGVSGAGLLPAPGVRLAHQIADERE